MAGKVQQEDHGDPGTGDKLVVQDLRVQREARGLTLADVSSLTKISMANLEAIESREFKKLPPPVYTKAYLKTYARLLETDEKPFVAQYEQYLAELPRAELTHNRENQETKEESSIFFKKRIIFPLLTILVFCLMWYLVYSQGNFRVADIAVDAPFMQKPAAPPPVAVTDSGDPAAPSPAPPQAMPVETPLGKELPVQGPASAETEKSSASLKGGEGETVSRLTSAPGDSASPAADRLLIIATEATWLRITEGKKQPYQLLLKPGERHERRGTEFAIDVGNAAGISVEFQGKKINNLGKPGEVVHLRLP